MENAPLLRIASPELSPPPTAAAAVRSGNAGHVAVAKLLEEQREFARREAQAAEPFGTPSSTGGPVPSLLAHR